MSIIDMHVHLAGVGSGDSGCWVSPKFRRRLTFRALRLMHGISAESMRTTADADWAARIARYVRESALDRAVALGFDGVYRPDGSLDPARSQMLVPDDWVFRVCHQHPELLPGPSINPFAADALQRLERCIERGATLIKWLPSAQLIDPADPRHDEFYRVMARARLPLLVHAGSGEVTFGELDPSLADVERLKRPLDAGVPVICAHTAARIIYRREPDQLPALRALLRAYPQLWVDNSGMANPGRFVHLARLARDAETLPRTLHGSDFPVPDNAVYYMPRLGIRAALAIDRIRNPLERDLRLKRALGWPDETLTRAAGVLANLDRWPQPSGARDGS
jgi:uncharacterized protein